MPFPDREDLSYELLKLLVAAQEGGATFAEVRLTARRIDFSSEQSWSEEWIRTARLNEERAERLLADAKLISARRNWLRAVNYYGAASYPADPSNDLLIAALSGMRRCASSFVRCHAPGGEVVSIPWLRDFALQGYFLRSSNPEPAPVVICVGEPGTRKEAHLARYVSHAQERGLSLLSVDMLGADLTFKPERFAGRQSLEAAISHVLDFLEARSGVDKERIAIIADSWSSSFVARAVAAESRFAAAVCDGGIWDLQSRAFHAQQATGVESSRWLQEPNLILRSIACPLLVTAGENGWLTADSLLEFGSQLSKEHSDATFKLFTQVETASMQGHCDNPTLSNETIFDWLEDRLTR